VIWDCDRNLVIRMMRAEKQRRQHEIAEKVASHCVRSPDRLSFVRSVAYDACWPAFDLNPLCSSVAFHDKVDAMFTNCCIGLRDHGPMLGDGPATQSGYSVALPVPSRRGGSSHINLSLPPHLKQIRHSVGGDQPSPADEHRAKFFVGDERSDSIRGDAENLRALGYRQRLDFILGGCHRGSVRADVGDINAAGGKCRLNGLTPTTRAKQSGFM
jgi:hypothetical protein